MELEKITHEIVDQILTDGSDLFDLEVLMGKILTYMDKYPELGTLENSIEVGTSVLRQLMQ